LRFHRDGEQQTWRQVNAGVEAAPVRIGRIDLRTQSAQDQTTVMAEQLAQMHAAIDLGNGPLVQAAWLDRGERPGTLLLLVHHLAIDVVSWQILLEDLWRAYGQLQQGQPVRLPAKTTSFKRWAEGLVEYARSDNLAAERAYWLDPMRASVARLPVDHPKGANTTDSVALVQVILDEARTQVLLREVPAAYKTQVNDVLLTGLLLAFQRWTGRERLLIALEGHGREEILPAVDLSRTVGWFTAIVPVLLDASEAATPAEALVAVKEQLRAIPNGGIGYGLLRYLGGDAQVVEQLRAMPAPEVLFNYMGKEGQLTRRAEAGGNGIVAPSPARPPDRQQHGPRNYLIEINGAVVAEQLRFNFAFSKNVYEVETIKWLTAEFTRALEEIVEHCQSPEAGRFTTSDFPEAAASQSDLDTLMAQLDHQEE
jgi:non-ribosomal peptide synthase protein (TIGR01720 family)